MGQKLVLWGSYIAHPRAVHIRDGCAQADGARHMGRAGLKFVRQLVVDRLLEGHRTDHVAAALVRRHRIQQSGFAIQNADASGTINLVTGKNVEVTIQSLHIHFETCVTATILVRGPSRFSKSSSSNSPLSLIGATRSLAPFSSHRICQGTILE